MNVKKVGNVILAVNDLERSVEFYNKILGMPIKNIRSNWVDLGQSGALLSLHPALKSEPHSGTSVDNGILIGLVVGDVESAVNELKSKNVKIHRDIQEREAGINAIIEKIGKIEGIQNTETFVELQKTYKEPVYLTKNL